MLLVYRRDRPLSWSRTEHTTEHKCAQDTPLHTTELALHTTGPICFDSLACLQIAFLTFEYSLQLLVLPNVCLTITENNALTMIAPVTHLNARNPLVLVPHRRVHVSPFVCNLPGCVLRNARLCAVRLGCVEVHPCTYVLCISSKFNARFLCGFIILLNPKFLEHTKLNVSFTKWLIDIKATSSSLTVILCNNSLAVIVISRYHRLPLELVYNTSHQICTRLLYLFD